MSTPAVPDDAPRLLFPAEVCDRLRVSPKTLARWRNAGKIRSARTPGGRIRYYDDDVKAIIAGTYVVPGDPP